MKSIEFHWHGKLSQFNMLVVARVSTKIAVWLYGLLAKDVETDLEKERKSTEEQFTLVASQWRNEFMLLSGGYFKRTGHSLNIGLIYSGQLGQSDGYGSGVALFWSEPYGQAGRLCYPSKYSTEPIPV